MKMRTLATFSLLLLLGTTTAIAADILEVARYPVKISGSLEYRSAALVAAPDGCSTSESWSTIQRYISGAWRPYSYKHVVKVTCVRDADVCSPPAVSYSETVPTTSGFASADCNEMHASCLADAATTCQDVGELDPLSFNPAGGTSMWYTCQATVEAKVALQAGHWVTDCFLTV